MDSLLLIGSVSIATPVVAALIIALTSALEPAAPAQLEDGALRREPRA